MNQNADLDWREGRIPVSRRFGDPYFSFENGLAETQHVFLNGNDLPARFQPEFHIAELGFGTGLNFFATLQAWRASAVSGRFCFTSFEAFPLQVAEIERALAAFPDILSLARPFLDDWNPDKSLFHHEGDDFVIEVIIGDARETLPGWAGRADAWFLDGFAPARNPELWEGPLLAEVARHTAPGGTLATYSAAGAVRRALSRAGFRVARVPGFGRKRHMTVARKPAS